MKSFSNTYIFIFSTVMVIIVAALLSVVAMSLGPRQDMNIKTETMQNILTSVRVESTAKNAEELFNKYITDSYVINPGMQKIENEVALEVDLKKEVSKIEKINKLEQSVQERKVSPFKSFMAGFINFKEINKKEVQDQIAKLKSERKLPVYVCQKENDTYYVMPLRGKGLWGPIWGFIALESDMNTVYGAVFDHKSETPGLGAEIKEWRFQKEFQGKKIFDDDNAFHSVDVVKGGTDAANLHGVDAISGGTITSKGVESMLYDCLISYNTFFEQNRD
ncbi:MAG: NADH:ubiquinone reductase (Na(+)-transporting) subunit C [Bacteroidales bacterium]|nr:NADH:ubiquinone reductase (Na(+)-transporting) subunit C [Bacteroidales bacterium]